MQLNTKKLMHWYKLSYLELAYQAHGTHFVTKKYQATMYYA